MFGTIAKRRWASSGSLNAPFTDRAPQAVVACFKEEHSAPVVHAVLSGSDLLAYGGTSVTIWKTRTTQ